MLAAKSALESLPKLRISEHPRDVHRRDLVFVVGRSRRTDVHAATGLCLFTSGIAYGVAICRPNFFVCIRKTSVEIGHPTLTLRLFCATLAGHGVSQLFRTGYFPALPRAHPTTRDRSELPGRLSASGCCRRWVPFLPSRAETVAWAKCQFDQRAAFGRLGSREMPLPGLAKLASACGARKLAHGH